MMKKVNKNLKKKNLNKLVTKNHSTPGTFSVYP